MLNFLDLYDTYATEVYRFALWLAGDSLDAEDITSETFIRAWLHNSTIRTETLKAYLLAIARNVYLGQQRRSTRFSSTMLILILLLDRTEWLNLDTNYRESRVFSGPCERLIVRLLFCASSMSCPMPKLPASWDCPYRPPR